MKRFLNQTLFTASTLLILLGSQACDPKKEVVQNFPHRPHAEAEISCDSCHEIQPQGITMPTMDTCMTCHDIDDQPVFGRCNECHDKQGIQLTADSGDKIVNHQVIFQPHIPENWYDVQYDHARFLTEESNCLACHGNIPQSEGSTLVNLPSMETAMAFHDRMGYSNDCQVCHTELTVFTEPPSHKGNWERLHGRLMVFEDRQQCMICHTETQNSCMTCHDIRQPRDHTNLFRRKTHGMKASWDRARCMECHRSDECESCHRAAADPVPPAPFHTPDASCLTCHSPLAAQGPSPRPPQRLMKPMPHRMMMGISPQRCLECHQF